MCGRFALLSGPLFFEKDWVLYPAGGSSAAQDSPHASSCAIGSVANCSEQLSFMATEQTSAVA